jgi:hypothetical protein
MAGALAHFGCRADHGFDQRFGDLLVVAPNIGHTGTERLHRTALLVTERVRKHDLQSIPLGGADKSQRDAGGSGGVLDDRSTTPKTTVGLGVLDGSVGHPVLHAACRIRPFQLGEHASRTARHHVAQLDEWSVADATEYVCRNRSHRRPPCAQRSGSAASGASRERLSHRGGAGAARPLHRQVRETAPAFPDGREGSQ